MNLRNIKNTHSQNNLREQDRINKQRAARSNNIIACIGFSIMAIIGAVLFYPKWNESFDFRLNATSVQAILDNEYIAVINKKYDSISSNIVKYHYVVNGIEYTGSDTIGSALSKEMTIYYHGKHPEISRIEYKGHSNLDSVILLGLIATVVGCAFFAAVLIKKNKIVQSPT